MYALSSLDVNSGLGWNYIAEQADVIWGVLSSSSVWLFQYSEGDQSGEWRSDVTFMQPKFLLGQVQTALTVHKQRLNEVGSCL